MPNAHHTVLLRLSNSDALAVVDFDDYPKTTGRKWSYQQPRTPGACAYVVSYEGRKTILLHRLILGNPTKEIDHRDGDGLNNRRSNLRLATRAQNGANTRKTSRPTSSMFKGVSRENRAGRRATGHAYIKVVGMRHTLGYFQDEEAAARAYDAAAKVAFGGFARLNFPDVPESSLPRINREHASAKRDTKRSHCAHGHALVEPNLYYSNGHRSCRECVLRRGKERRRRDADV